MTFLRNSGVYTAVVCVYGTVVSKVQWCMSWNSGVYSTMVCVYGTAMSTVQWRGSKELWSLDSSDFSKEQWCLHSSGLCLWYGGVQTTVMCLRNSSVYIAVMYVCEIEDWRGVYGTVVPTRQ